VPELPDVVVYIEALEARVLNHTLENIRIASPFVLRSVTPAPSVLLGKKVRAIRRLGKQIVFAFDGEHFLVIHLMIAGRLHWVTPDEIVETIGALQAVAHFHAVNLRLRELEPRRGRR